ncbi:translational GTPase TypA [Elusimicrobiota bacterium]
MNLTQNRRKDLRNIAIIAHVDHGKTTLIDAMLKQTGTFTVKPLDDQTVVLDSNELERERGITILAKITSVPYKDVSINIVDTPGHADFGSEVERILKMVDGALLLVDAVEGPMPQTRFVLRKALALGLRPIVVINKMDRSNTRPKETLERVFGLFIDLGASDPQMEFPVVYAAGRSGWASLTPETGKALTPLFETIIEAVPGPAVNEQKPLQMLITMLGYDNHLGRSGIGRVLTGRLTRSEPFALIKPSGEITRHKITMLKKFTGLFKEEIDEARAGDIVCVSGAQQINVGDTISSCDNPVALPPLEIDEPTLSLSFTVNDSPLSGLDGKFSTARHLKDRLLREQQTNVGLKVEIIDGEGAFRVSGRGELHIAILIETMRREGFELAVSKPEVIFRKEGSRIMEPMEHLVIDAVNADQGVILECIGRRGAEFMNMTPEGTTRTRFEYTISSRSLMGLKTELMSLTKGTAMMHHSFLDYGPKASDPAGRNNGVLVAKEKGITTGYALDSLQVRNTLFVTAGVEVYEGMLVGICNRDNDMVVNPCKAKAMSNMRTKATDEAVVLTPPLVFTLEQSMEFIDETELVEVTPKNIRLRKKTLCAHKRKREQPDTRA